MATAATVGDDYFRNELAGRRRRLAEVGGPVAAGDLEALIADVDAALARLGQGTYHECTVCHEDIELDRLVADPLARCCSEHLSPEEHVRMDRDLALARSIQLGLLPSCRTVDGWSFSYRYEAAGGVGGDFCDVIPLPAREETLVLVGDVSGKGIAAALLMTSLLATFRSLSTLGMPTGDLLTRVNDLFQRSAPSSTFATLAAATLHRGGVVDVYSAGHWPPLARRAGAAAVVPVEPGVPLGVFAGSRYLPTRLALAPGETLLFFTDGVVEAEDRDGRDYGADRLTSVLGSATDEAPDALIARCLQDVRSFQDAGRGADDLLLFAVRAAGDAASSAAA